MFKKVSQTNVSMYMYLHKLNWKTVIKDMQEKPVQIILPLLTSCQKIYPVMSELVKFLVFNDKTNIFSLFIVGFSV
jgi:hypothetical protein